jgi:glycerol-3-phosphate dehydrogenase
MAHAYGERLNEMLHEVTDLGDDLGGGLTETEVRWMRDRDGARTAEDVLWRRSKIGLHVDADITRQIASLLDQPLR